MIIGLGVDIVEISRIRAVYARHKERFLSRVLTRAEQDYVCTYADPGPRLAGRWAAKEAALKALGTGLAQGISWHDVEILRNEAGKPILVLHGQALARATALGTNRYHVSISHGSDLAFAQVILEGGEC